MDFERFLNDIGIGGLSSKDQHRGDQRYAVAFAFLDLASYAKELLWTLRKGGK